MELKEKYLLNFTDHLSQLSKCYLIKDKSAESKLEKIKGFIKNIGKSEIFQLIIRVKFRANIINSFCEKMI